MLRSEWKWNKIMAWCIFSLASGFICCGHEYVSSSTTLCCVGNEGYPTMHPAGNATVTLRCCGSKVIHQDQECCSGIGFDPRRHVCADRPTPGLVIEVCDYVRQCVFSVCFLVFHVINLRRVNLKHTDHSVNQYLAAVTISFYICITDSKIKEKPDLVEWFKFTFPLEGRV